MLRTPLPPHAPVPPTSPSVTSLPQPIRETAWVWRLVLALCLLVVGIVLLALLLRARTGLESDVPRLPTGVPQVGGSGSALSQWQVVIVNELAEPVADMAVWDGQSRFLGATDSSGAVAVWLRHPHDATDVTVRAFQTGITPPTTQYRCAEVRLPLPAPPQAHHIVLDGAGIMYTVVHPEGVAKSAAAVTRAAAPAASATNLARAGGIAVPARLPAMVRLLQLEGGPTEAPLHVRITYSRVAAGKALPLVSVGGSPATQDFRTAWRGISAATAMAEIARAMATVAGFLQAVFPGAASVVLEDVGEEDAEAPPLDANGYDLHDATGRPRIGDIRIGVAPLSGSMARTLAFAYNPNPTLPAAEQGGLGSDIIVNSRIAWSADALSQQRPGTFSLALVMVHEVLHAIGLGHHPSLRAIMGVATMPGTSLTTRYPSGLTPAEAPAAAAGLRLLYSSSVPQTPQAWVRGSCAALPAPAGLGDEDHG